MSSEPECDAPNPGPTEADGQRAKGNGSPSRCTRQLREITLHGDLCSFHTLHVECRIEKCNNSHWGCCAKFSISNIHHSHNQGPLTALPGGCGTHTRITHRHGRAHKHTRSLKPRPSMEGRAGGRIRAGLVIGALDQRPKAAWPPTASSRPRTQCAGGMIGPAESAAHAPDGSATAVGGSTGLALGGA